MGVDSSTLRTSSGVPNTRELIPLVLSTNGKLMQVGSAP